jgi:hypothetical protein
MRSQANPGPRHTGIAGFIGFEDAVPEVSMMEYPVALEVEEHARSMHVFPIKRRRA